MKIEPRRLALAGVFVVVCIASLDHNIVATALPRIGAEFGAVDHIAWVVTAFLLPSTIVMPLYGKFADSIGARAILSIAILIFLAASLLCGVAGSMEELIAYRALQGLGAGGLFTLSITWVADLSPPDRRAHAHGLIVTAAAICQIAGPLLGGVLTEHASWRWIFLINLPLGLIALTLIFFGMPSTPKARSIPIDYPGAAVMTTSALMLLYGLSILSTQTFIGGLLASAAVLGGGLFVAIEKRAPHPLVPLQLFRAPGYATIVTAYSALTFSVFATAAFTPLFLQVALGMTPSQSGLAMIAQVAGMVLCNVSLRAAPSLTANLKGAAVASVALELFALLGFAACAFADANAVWFVALLFVRGLGMGANMPILTTIAQNSAEVKQVGVATSTMMFLRSLSGVVGVTLIGLAITAVALSNTAPLLADRYAFAIGLAFLFNALMVGFALGLISRMRVSGFRAPAD